MAVVLVEACKGSAVWGTAGTEVEFVAFVAADSRAHWGSLDPETGVETAHWGSLDPATEVEIALEIEALVSGILVFLDPLLISELRAVCPMPRVARTLQFRF